MRLRPQFPLILAVLFCATASAFATASLSTFLALGEISAPSVSGAGEARLYADSTAHALKVSENGGAFAAVPVDGGNSLGASLTLGTNDAQSLILETQGTTRVTLGTASLVSTFPITLPTGSVSATSVQFTSDPNTGLYSPGADSLGLVTGGTARLTMSTTSIQTTLPIRGQAGTVSAPAVSFSSDSDTGLYNTANVLLFSAGGTAICNVSATGLAVTSGVFTCPGSAGAGTEKFGLGCDAAATNSVAGGYSCTTSGASGGPVVWGWGSSSSGLYATCVGAQSNATGDATTAIGGGVVVSGAQSTALGTGSTTATATLAVALGAYATASGTGSIAIGGNTPQATFGGDIALGASAVTDAANQLKIGSAAYFIAQEKVVAGGDGQGWTDGVTTELLTLSTSGTTTDTAANLLPADSIIYAVTVRVVTTISGGGVASYSVGDSGSGTRFASAVTPITAGSTKVGLGAPCSAQASAAKVRITTSATPSAGAVRITVHYRTFTPPAS